MNYHMGEGERVKQISTGWIGRIKGTLTTIAYINWIFDNQHNETNISSWAALSDLEPYNPTNNTTNKL